MNKNIFTYLFTGLLLVAATFGFAAFDHSGQTSLNSTIILLGLGTGAVTMLTKAIKEEHRDKDGLGHM